MNSISIRSRGSLTFHKSSRYVNFSSQYVDGKVKLTPAPVVAPSLAAESSVLINKITRPDSRSRGMRHNVDAVDLEKELKN